MQYATEFVPVNQALSALPFQIQEGCSVEFANGYIVVRCYEARKGLKRYDVFFSDDGYRTTKRVNLNKLSHQKKIDLVTVLSDNGRTSHEIAQITGWSEDAIESLLRNDPPFSAVISRYAP